MTPSPNRSKASSLASLPKAKRSAFLASLTPAELETLNYRWEFWARPEQLPPSGPWRFWCIKAGRGWGKTRTNLEWVRARVERGIARRVALVGPTAASTRDVMVEGPSGILSISPEWSRPRYTPTKAQLTWPNGAIGYLYSAEEPERLRGPQHDTAALDEISAWDIHKAEATFGNMDMGLRADAVGGSPQACITFTPKPTPLVRAVLKSPDTVLARGNLSTRANTANLAPGFVRQIEQRYGGTRLGRQELEAELLEDTPGALWTLEILDHCRLPGTLPPPLNRVVVSVDPSGGDGEGNAEQGIIVAGRGNDGKGYVLADRSCKLSPDGWGRQSVQAYLDYQADMILAEVNYGGAMVEAVIRTAAARMALEGARTGSVAIRVLSATRGKRPRAEPVAALYEQGRILHCGSYPQLEEQMVGWTPEQPSPDRMDALVWAFTDLLVEGAGSSTVPAVAGEGYRTLGPAPRGIIPLGGGFTC